MWISAACHSRMGRVLLALGLLLAGTVRAQTPAPPLSGIVTDTLGVPLPLAEIIAVGETDETRGPHRARASTTGRFTFPSLAPGQYILTVRRIGYVPVQVTVALPVGAPVTLEFELVPRPQVLADIVTEVPARDAGPVGPLLHGTVVDSGGAPIPGAEVILGGASPKTRGPWSTETRTEGRFAFPELRPGKYFLTVRRIGFLPVQMSLTVEEREPRNFRFMLNARPFDLPDIVVEGMQFNVVRATRRAHAYLGTFLTRDDIMKAAPVVLGDLVRTLLPGVRPDTFSEPNLGLPPRYKDISYGIGPLNNAAKAGTGRRGVDCPPVISINGAKPQVGWAVNDFDPQQIEAMEVYGPGADIPWEFQEDLLIKRSCGKFMVIWLRYGNSVAR